MDRGARSVYNGMQKTGDPDIPTVNALLTEARDRLIAARTLVMNEIATYPTPIAGCDVQFNHLLAERHRIARALDALAEEAFIPTPRMPAPAPRLESR